MAEAVAEAAPLGCPAEPSPEAPSGLADGADGFGLEVSTRAVREGVKAELLELFGTRSQLRDIFRQEVLGALESWCGGAIPILEGSSPVGRQAEVPYSLDSSKGLSSPATPRQISPAARSLPEATGGCRSQPLPVLEKVVTDQSAGRPRVLERVATDNSSGRLKVKVSRPDSPIGKAASGLSRIISEVEYRLGSEGHFSQGLAAALQYRLRSEDHFSQTHSSVQSAGSEGAARQHFNTVAMASSGSGDDSADLDMDLPVVRKRTSLWSKVSSLWSAAVQDQPARKGVLATMVTSRVFESSIRAAIVANCAFLVYLANEDIKAWDEPPHVVATALEIFFLVVYLFEMIVKLIVHRVYYFVDKSNCFDCLLVCIDMWDVVTRYVEIEAFSAGYLSILRLLRLGKALRAVQVVRSFEKLRAFLVCINGSLSSLAWSLVMLSIILYMFSLGLVQIIALHFRDSGDRLDEEGRMAFETSFGSVQMSMLTLFQLSTDGAGWMHAYNLISQTGWIGSLVFLAYVSFTHIAVINIITGIFVESAMQNLAPDRDSLALDHQFKEQQAAEELEQLLKRSNRGFTGRVSKEEFDDLVKDGRLPRLLSLLGLREQHARDFFKFLSSASPDGEVPINAFVRGCMKLKGSATSFDLHLIQVEVQTISRSLKDLKRWTKSSSARSDLLAQ